MSVTLDWLGCATFRLTIDDTVLFLDAYLDRVPLAPPVGLAAAEVERADYILVGHAHFDHIAGAETIALRTGARVIASNESARVLLEAGVPQEQILPSQGGERHRLAAGVTVEVVPSLHSCIWVGGSWDTSKVVVGHYGLCEDERWHNDRPKGIGEPADGADPAARRQVSDHLATTIGSRRDGGALGFLIHTPYGSIFFHDTSGNFDGDPIQGSLAQFVGRMASILRPPRLTLGHHDDWMPPMTRDMTSAGAIAPVRNEIARMSPRTDLVELPYRSGYVVFD